MTELTQQLFFSCVLLTVPLLYSNASIDQALLRMVALWAGFLFLLSLQQYKVNREIRLVILLMIYFAAVIEALRYWWLMSEGFVISGEFPGRQNLLIYGIFQQRNVFASFIATGMVLSAYLLAQIDRTDKSYRLICPLLLLGPVLFIQILYSMSSRTGWYGVLIGCLLVIPFFLSRARRLTIVAWLTSVILGVGVVFATIALDSSSASTRNILSLEGGRLFLFPQTIDMIIAKPFIGWGYGNFESSYITHAARAYSEGKFDRAGLPEAFHPHNELLLWTAEGGLVALFGMLFAAWSVWKVVSSFPLAQRIAVIGLFFPITLHTMTELPFYQSMIHWITFIIFIHHADSQVGRSVNLNPQFGSALRVLALAIPFASIVFLGSTLYAGLALNRFNSGQTTMREIASIGYPTVWRNRLDWSINLNLLLRGGLTSDETLVRRFVEWAPTLIERMPRPIFYDYLIQAHYILGEEEQAAALTDEFYYFFPHKELQHSRML